LAGADVSKEVHFVGLDVSDNLTAICIVNNGNEVVSERKVRTDPEAIARYVKSHSDAISRVGLEAGPMSEWLYVELIQRGLPAVCVEARHAHSFIQSQINKNDRNDARGIARMMMCGVFKPVHVKSAESQRLRALLGARKIIQQKMIDLELHVRGTLKSFGHHLGQCSRDALAARASELVEGDPMLAAAIIPLLQAHGLLQQQFDQVHRQVLRIAVADPVCCLLMTAPGVGAITALTFKCSVDNPMRLHGSKSVGALFGMTPRQHQSGQTDVLGPITKQGGDDLRKALFEAGIKILVNVQQPSALRTWGLDLASRKGRDKAAVAVGRRLGSILRRMWLDGRPFDPGAPHAAKKKGLSHNHLPGEFAEVQQVL
jgi:transposase